jgi:hypothetical protein
LVGDVLGVHHGAVGVDDEHRAHQQPPLLEQDAVVAGELLTGMRGQSLVLDALGASPASLGEGRTMLIV